VVQVAEVPRALAGDARTGVTNCPERALRIEE
jgi:ferredoxin